MHTSTAVLIASAIALLGFAVLFGGKLPAQYRARSCQGKAWRQSFPRASKTEIRQFLSIFTNAFAFDHAEKLKLSPNDQLLSIYRALYPHKWQPDALEFETLAQELQSQYGVNFSAVWREDLTLGQLFNVVRTNNAL